MGHKMVEYVHMEMLKDRREWGYGDLESREKIYKVLKALGFLTVKILFSFICHTMKFHGYQNATPQNRLHQVGNFGRQSHRKNSS